MELGGKIKDGWKQNYIEQKMGEFWLTNVCATNENDEKPLEIINFHNASINARTIEQFWKERKFIKN